MSLFLYDFIHKQEIKSCILSGNLSILDLYILWSYESYTTEQSFK